MRADSALFLADAAKFFREQFFPHLDESGIDTVIHLGDLVDRRKYINYFILDALQSILIDPLVERGIKFHIVVGNHDSYFKNTIRINAVDKIFRGIPNVEIYRSPVEAVFDSARILFTPWICESNARQVLESIKDSRATILCGHFEIFGFEMHSGIVSPDGLSRSAFSNYELVLSGHFHNRSSCGNITYLGSPFDMSFADIGQRKGFYVLDTEDLSLAFIENRSKLFFKHTYNDQEKSVDQIFAHDFESYRDKYVKVIVEHKDDAISFDRFIDEIRKAAPRDLSIIDYDEIGFTNDSVEMVECQDTISILSSFIDTSQSSSLRDGKTKEEVKLLMRDLYVNSAEDDSEC